ncbi:unnamed protein product [Sympodiomycopsis kandeliae]
MASIPVPLTSSSHSHSITYSTIPPYTLQLHFTDDQQIICVRLPSEVASDQSDTVQLGNTATSPAQDHVAIRLRGPASRPAPWTLDLPRAYFSAAHLKSRSAHQLVCSTCSNPIVSTADSTTYTALPSEHWEELIDSWMCHSDQLLNASVARGREGLEDNSGLKLGEIRVADGYIVSSVEALIGDATNHFSDRKVYCSACGTTLGQLVPLKGSSAGPDSQIQESNLLDFSLRLEKYALAMPAGAASYSPLLLYVADELESKSRAHATRYFMLTDESNGEEMALLWLFQPFLSLSLSLTAAVKEVLQLPSSHQINDQLVLLASKILFVQTEEAGSTTGPGRFAFAMGSSQDTETLCLPRECCDALLKALRVTNELYPPSRRKLGERWNIAWIPRCRGEDRE